MQFKKDSGGFHLRPWNPSSVPYFSPSWAHLMTHSPRSHWLPFCASLPTDKVKSFRSALQEEEQASKQINPKRPRAL